MATKKHLPKRTSDDRNSDAVTPSSNPSLKSISGGISDSMVDIMKEQNDKNILYDMDCAIRGILTMFYGSGTKSWTGKQFLNSAGNNIPKGDKRSFIGKMSAAIGKEISDVLKKSIKDESEKEKSKKGKDEKSSKEKEADFVNVAVGKNNVVVLQVPEVQTINTKAIKDIVFLVNHVIEVADKLDEKTIKRVNKVFGEDGEAIKVFNRLNDFMQQVEDVVSEVKAQEGKTKEKLEEMKSSFKQISEILNVIAQVAEINFSKALGSMIRLPFLIRMFAKSLGPKLQKAMNDVNNALKKLKGSIDLKAITDFGKVVETIVGVGKHIQELTGIKATIKMYFGFKNLKRLTNKMVDLMVEISKKFESSSPEDTQQVIKNVAEFVKVFKELGAVGKQLLVLKLLGFAIKGGMEGAEKIVKGMAQLGKEIVKTFNEKEAQQLKTAAKALKDIAKLILMCGAILLFGALVGGIVIAKWKEIGMFSLALIALIKGLCYAIKGANIHENMKYAMQIGVFVLICAGILFLAAWLGKYVTKKWKDVLLFTLMLAAFIGILLFTISVAFFGMQIEGPMLMYIAGFILACAAILLLGGLFLMMGGTKLVMYTFAWLLLFGAFLFAVAITVGIIFLLLSSEAPMLVYIAGFVLACAIVLLLPAYFLMKNPELLGAIVLWGLCLSVFLWVITKFCAELNEMSVLLMSGGVVLGYVALLLISLAFTLGIIALVAWFISEHELWFASAIVYIGMLVMLGAVVLFCKMLNKHAPDILTGGQLLGWVAVLLIGIATALGIVAVVAWFIKKYDLYGASAWVYLGMLGLLGAVTGMIFILGMVGNKIRKSVSMMKQITILIGVCCGALIVIAGVAWFVKKQNIMEMFWWMFAAMIGMMVCVVGICGIISLGGPAGVAVFASAAAAMILVGIVIALLCTSMLIFAFAAKQVKGMNDKDMENVGKLVTTMIELLVYVAGAFVMIGGPIGMFAISQVISSLRELANLIAEIGNAVWQFSKLTIPILDKDGKETGGVRQLSQDDFRKCAENVTTIVTILSDTIIKIYQKDPSMFEDDEDNPFIITITSLTHLAKLISKLAQAVKEYADLNITIYNEKGEEKGKRHLTQTDFKECGKNITEIVTCLSRTIINLYKTNPEMFDDDEDSIYIVVVNAVKKLGGLISEIAKGVQDWASMTFTTTNEEGKEIKQRITEQDKKDAATNIGDIVKFLSKTVIDIAKKYPEYFDDGDDSEFVKICECVSKLGSMISNIASGLKDLSTLEYVTKYDEEGKPIEKRPWGAEDFTNAANNISKVIVTLAQSVVDTYKNNPDIFDDEKNEQIFDSIAKLGEMVSNIASGLKDYATLGFDQYDNSGKVIGKIYMQPEDFDKAAQNISKIITTVAETIYLVATGQTGDKVSADAMKKLFEYTDEMGDNQNEFCLIASSLDTVADVIGKYVGVIKSLCDLKWGDVQVTSEMFKRSVENMKLLLTTPVKAIAESYFGKDENGNEFKTLFDQSADFDGDKDDVLSGTPIEKIVVANKKVSEIIEDVVKKITSAMKIYEETLSEDKRQEALKGISSVLTTLMHAICTCYTENQELFDQAVESTQSISILGHELIKFDNTDKGADNNVFSRVCVALLNSSWIVKNVIDVIKEMDVITETAVSEFCSPAFKEKIAKVITILAMAVYEAGECRKDPTTNKLLRFDDLYGDKSIERLNTMNNTFSKIEEIVSKTVAYYKDIQSKIAEITDIDDLNTKMGNVLSGFGKVLFEVYEYGYVDTETEKQAYAKKYWYNLWDDESNSRKLQTIVNVISQVSDLVKHIGATMTELANGVLSKEQQEQFDYMFGMNDASVADSPFGKLILAMPRALQEVADTPINKATGWERFCNGFRAKENQVTPLSRMIQSLNESSNFLIGYIDTLNQLIEWMNSDAVKVVLDDKQFSENVKYMLTRVPVAMILAANQLESYKATFKYEGGGSYVREGVAGVKTTTQQMISYFNDLYSDVNELLPKLETTYQNLKDVMIAWDNITNKDQIATIFTEIPMSFNQTMSEAYDNALDNVNKMLTFFDDFNGAYGSLVQSNSIEHLKSFVADLSSMTVNVEGVTQVTNAIVHVQEAIANTPDTSEFQKEVDGINKFRSAINQIPDKKIEKLTQMVNSFSKFAGVFNGNIEKFTSVMATKIAVVLEYLTKELDEATKTINKQDQIAKKREQRLKDMIKELKDVAEKGLEVSVTCDDYEEEDGEGMMDGESDTSLDMSSISSSPGVSTTTTTSTGGDGAYIKADNKTPYHVGKGIYRYSLTGTDDQGNKTFSCTPVKPNGTKK